jgi:hypothetical protein
VNISVIRQNEVTGDYHVDDVDEIQEPAPTDEQEEQEHDDADGRLLINHLGAANEQLDNPTHKRYNQKDHFEQSALFVKPLVKVFDSHN